MSRVFAVGLDDQNRIAEDVAVPVATSRGRSAHTSEVLVFWVRPRPPRCDGVRARAVGAPGRQATRLFEDTCAWLAAHAPVSVQTLLPRVAWRTVAAR
ncbi:MAG TPA: hypothetical protein VIW24_16975 [Aldersonia sp.]